MKIVNNEFFINEAGFELGENLIQVLYAIPNSTSMSIYKSKSGNLFLGIDNIAFLEDYYDLSLSFDQEGKLKDITFYWRPSDNQNKEYGHFPTYLKNLFNTISNVQTNYLIKANIGRDEDSFSFDIREK